MIIMNDQQINLLLILGVAIVWVLMIITSRGDEYDFPDYVEPYSDKELTESKIYLDRMKEKYGGDDV